MSIVKNLPLLMNLSYYGYNRGLGGDFTPEFNKDGTVRTTFCNKFIQYVLNGFGYGNMNSMLANQMIAFMEAPQNGWIKVSDTVAQQHANNGVIVIAGHSKEPHGHICLIIPGIMENSNSFKKDVPKCVNIGKDVFYGKRVSFAFRAEEMPNYYALAMQI